MLEAYYTKDVIEAGCDEAGRGCLAGPVFDGSGHVVASVGITTLTMFHTHDSMVEQYLAPVLAACRKISRTLGYVESLGAGSAAEMLGERESVRRTKETVR